ncbi:MAG: SGNH/GDSL hydrolase family protein [Chthoniobacterales bacterium]
MPLQSDDTLLFIGDSITDCGRDRQSDGPDSLGGGYVNEIARQLAMRQPPHEGWIRNRGNSGNRIYDIEQRLDADCLSLQPSVVFILAGINDVWRKFDSGVVSEIAEFQASFQRILERVRSEIGARIVILEPFLLPVPEDRRAWRVDLDPKIHGIRELAAKYASVYVPLDGLFAAECCHSPAAHWLPDGVHPSEAGHQLIAQAVLSRL